MAFWESQGGAAAIGAGAALLGNSGPEMPRKFLRTNKKLLAFGNELDMENQKEMFDYRINQGLDAGLTPWEMFTSGAGGAGGGTSGSGATLGNNYSQAAVQAEAQANQRDMQQAQIMGNLAAVQMQTDAQKEVAQIQSGDTRRGQDIQATIAEARLAFDQNHFDKVVVPQAAADLGITEQQTLKAMNEVVTSNPKFIRAMKQLTMGVDNLYVETLVKEAGASPVSSQEDWDKIPEHKRAALMAALDKARSTTAREIGGLTAVLKGFVDWLKDDAVTDTAASSDPREAYTEKRSLGDPPPDEPIGEGNRLILGTN